MIKKIVILITTLVFISQSVNANELNKFNQKFNNFFELLIDKIQNEVEETKNFQIREWKEVKQKHQKSYKTVQHKLTGFFSDFPNSKGDK
tara:strand:+ start:574 stop:843 length:270 start_codon:yes stop_codon:yes gene_type:complete